MAKSFADSLSALAAQSSTMSLRSATILTAEEETWTLDTSGRYKSTDNFADGKRYEDVDFSYVDNKKTVKINENQINLTQEDSSQYMPFEMFRYYDGIDLKEMKLSVYFLNVDDAEGEATPINVRYSNTKIRFGFLVPKEATAIKGKLRLEIWAKGTNPLGGNYWLKTKPNDDIEILESLHGNGNVIVDEGWATSVLEEVQNAALDAQAASTTAQNAATEAQAALDEVDAKIENVSSEISNAIKAEMENTYYTIEETDAAIKTSIDTYNTNTVQPLSEAVQSVSDDFDAHISDSNKRITGIEDNVKNLLSNFDNYYQKTETYTQTEIDQKIADIDVTSQLNTLEAKIAKNYYNKEEIDQKISDIDVSDQLANYYTKTEANTNFASKDIETTVATHTTDIQTANTAIASINEVLESIDTSPNKTYEAVYNDTTDENVGENVFVLYEITNEGQEGEERTIKSKFTIVGGSGGSSSANTIKIERVTNSPLVVTANDKVIIEYNFIGTDASGDDIGQGNVTWKLGNRVIKTETVYTGINSADLTEYLSVTSDQKVTLIISDDIGTTQQKIWYVSVVDVKLESSFDDTKTYAAGSAVNFTYIPYGAVDKTIHVLLDGKEIGTVTSSKSAAGLSTSYTVPAHEHGTHLLEMYMTATINNNDIESNHIVKDIIWYDETSDKPVIGCIQQNFTARQYETTNITYTVYDPSTETPNVTLKATYINEDGETVETYNSSLVLTSNTDVWSFKTDIIGEHTLTITCGNVVKTLKATIEELGIEVSPTTAGLEFDFNPVGYSNNDENRIWSDKNTGVAMTVSDNFDWINGGYQIDESGDQYFCIKAGTTATINYNLFADDAKANGKEFKVIFKTTNVKNRNTSFISCMDYGIGLDMKVESANIYSSNGSLYSPYCEEDVIEFEFNINKNTDIPMVMTYEDGVGNRPMIYTSDSSFWQTNPAPIAIGSSNCDVHIYRMKAYSTSLSDKDILNNFIADARSAEEMIARYTRNQIYKEGVLDPEYLAEICPDLRIILVDAPWFTNDKDNKIDDTNITMIYKNGDPVLDNWTCTGARHRGQGTSSNEYGYSSRNIDLVMDTETSLFTLGDGKTTASTITLTRDSVPTDYLNVKVNVASSENANNAQNARNYSLFNPFIRFARWKDSKVKDCMEFYNCVVFIRERDEDISTHREFQDTNYHFYSIGNVGDSKKTDDTRVNNKKDPKECIVEITDYNVPLAEFPTGKDGICPESEWKAGNTAYDFLYSEYEYEDGEFKAFGAGSYEFRYEMKGITDEQRQANIDTWREMYKFIVTSSDEDFYAKLKEWFVVDSALYYYLFTERYCMPDNRAKNSFWHYGKVYITTEEAATLGDDANGYTINNEQASIRNGYRWDLTQGYDFDTSLGIDNTGKLILTYGKEDTDFYVDGDSTSGYIYRAAESTFFCRLRDLFASEMQAMFVDRENQNAWSASRLIKQWDDAQNQFPEELWRLDIQRKYLRTYQGISIDNSFPGAANPRFLTEMMNGRKKYQRRMFERNQELYMATKYFGKVATQDQIMMRFNNPVGATIAPDFTLYITPYSDMYIGTSFGNVTPTNFRAKAGIEYTIPCSIESGTADITLIYGAGFIQAIGDLSKCYVGDNDFSKASRLQSLVIGSDANGYVNSFMTKISLGNNKLLEYLDIRKITGLNSVVDLSLCANLLELHAEGSGATGVIFANGGKLQKAYIPAVTSLTMKNLNYLEEFVVESYNKLQTLIVEYTPFINTHDIVNTASILKVLRLIGIDWDIETTDILGRILLMRGVNNTGGEISMSVLAGEVFVPVVRQQELYEFQSAWQDLEITYNTLIEQYPVTFVNEDGTILDVQYIDKGSDAEDPITRKNNPIATPTKESTISTDYTFAGWDIGFTGIFAARTITATYTETTREYTITYKSKGVTLQTSTGLYGENVPYTGDIPIYTAEESAYMYYLFTGWDQSGIIDGNKTVNAVFDSCKYTNTYFDGKDLSELRPVEIYAMIKVGVEQTYVESMDNYNFSMGHDYTYDDVESYELITEKTMFTGKNYIDTKISVLDIDRSFVLAVDYEFGTNNNSGATLMQCFQTDGSDGFKLLYNGYPRIQWGTSADQCAIGTNREMLVLRHVAGETGLHVYISNLSSTSSGYFELERAKTTIMDSTLVFGCVKADDGVYESFATGAIHWAKLWFADLGESACQELAAYIHEDINVQMCGFKRKYLSNVSGQRSSMSFLTSHALYTKKPLSDAYSNTGGWGVTTLNTWLNSRFYSGLPIQIKQLIKQVKVISSIGNQSTETSSSDCYIYIPAIIELSDSITSEPYYSEETASNKTIDYMVNNSDRIRTDSSGNATAYWTRSPSATSSQYFYYIKTDGTTSAFGQAPTENGIVIEFSI